MSRTLCAVSEVVPGLPLPLREGVGGRGSCRTEPLPPTPSLKGRGRLFSSVASASRSVRSTPALLRRSGYRSRGKGMRGFGASPTARRRSTGSSMMASSGTDASTSRCTKLVLAPFSKQAPHEIGQQVLVRADRGIDAHRTGWADNAVIQRLAHAVQALHFEFSPGGVFQHECQAVRVMRSEGRFDGIGRSQHVPRVGQASSRRSPPCG